MLDEESLPPTISRKNRPFSQPHSLSRLTVYSKHCRYKDPQELERGRTSKCERERHNVCSPSPQLSHLRFHHSTFVCLWRPPSSLTGTGTLHCCSRNMRSLRNQFYQAFFPWFYIMNAFHEGECTRIDSSNHSLLQHPYSRQYLFQIIWRTV